MPAHVVITGASSGLGREIALQYARKKAVVVLAARRVDLLAKVAEEVSALGGTAYFTATDVAVEESCKSLAEFSRQKLNGRIDFLVINAGIGQRGKVIDVTDTSVYQRLLNVNALGAVWVTHYCLPMLVSEKRRGHVIAISSVSGLLGFPGLAGYCMSKFALQGFFEALRNEQDVGVTIVNPGFMDTDMPAKNLSANGSAVGTGDGVDRGKAIDPQYVAKQAILAAENGTRDVNPHSILLSICRACFVCGVYPRDSVWLVCSVYPRDMVCSLHVL